MLCGLSQCAQLRTSVAPFGLSFLSRWGEGERTIMSHHSTSFEEGLLFALLGRVMHAAGTRLLNSMVELTFYDTDGFCRCCRRCSPTSGMDHLMHRSRPAPKGGANEL